jgi:universal stress protein E
MKLIDKILLAHDFGASAKNVVGTAIELAKIFQAEVIPIHILPDDMANDKVKTLLNETATAKLRETVGQLQEEGVQAGSPILAFGSPHEEIVEAAVRVNANLILTGSGETQQGDQFLLGTTAERIIQKSEKPVFVIKEGMPLNVQHILCPIDFSATSKRALKDAITMAHRFKAELTILGVCELQGSAWFSSPANRDLENDRRCLDHRAKFAAFLADFNLADLPCHREIRNGDPAREILNTVSEKMIDLLVMGTTGKTGLSRWVIGSVTEKVVRVVPCSFVTLKSENLISLQLENNIQDLENRYETGQQLVEDGFFEEAIEQFKLGLRINNMHVPSYFAIAKVYEKLDQSDQAEAYRNSARDILNRIWDQKIEEEVRKLRSY